MPYPKDIPKMKHDMLCPRRQQGTLNSQMGFSSSTELFRALEEEASPPAKLCSLYSYPDGPDYPGPLSRALMIVGVADTSVSLVRMIISNDEVPDCLHKCTLAVKLADADHIGHLTEDHIRNSKEFAKIIKQLRREEAVAILGKDKLGRFGILVPFPNADDDPSEYTADDFAAMCYVGDVQEVMNFLTHRTASTADQDSTSAGIGLWQPPSSATVEESAPTSAAGLWKPPGADDDGEANGGTAFSAPWEANDTSGSAAPWETIAAPSDSGPLWVSNDGDSSSKRSFDDMNGSNHHDTEENGVDNEKFHADKGAAAADAFYSGLTRSLDTRAASRLYHMRAFNGWVKATQIQELDPRIFINGKVQPRSPMRILDLACGKGGDLTKWTLHDRGIRNYVGIDVARGSLRDAAERAREMRKRNKLDKAIFTCADLGADVPGRKRTPSHKYMQKLSSWSLQDEDMYESGPPDFKMVRGGGISENERFDVVSIQFAIHYMMQTAKRARRFFHTVSQLLEVGGNLVCTTIDARVVINHMIDLGLNLHPDEGTEPDFDLAVVQAGAGACKLRFEPEVVRRLFASKADGSKVVEDLFGLEYTFTLVEGSDHSAGVGDAVNLPEWLIPVPVLVSLAKEAGLELEYAQNFHEFFEARKDPTSFPAAHHALYNMKVLNRNGTISADEWSVSRLYVAIKFRKDRESSITTIEDDEEDDEDGGDEAEEKATSEVELDPEKAKKFYPMAMMKAKRTVGEDLWKTLSSDEKQRLTQLELVKLAGK